MAVLAQTKHHGAVTSVTVRAINTACDIVRGEVDKMKGEGYTVVGSYPGTCILVCPEHAQGTNDPTADFCFIASYSRVPRARKG